MSKLEDALKKLQETELTANLDINTVDWKQRAGWGMRINAAKYDLKAVTADYQKALGEQIRKKVFMAGSDEAISQFVAIVGDGDVGGLSIDASAFYRKLADRTSPTLGTRGEFSVTQWKIIDSVLKSMQDELGKQHKVMHMTAEIGTVITSYDQLLNFIREGIRKTNGDKLNIIMINQRITKQAIAIEQTDPCLLFIRGAKDDEIANLAVGLIGGEAVILTIPENPTPEWVQEQLNLLVLWKDEGVVVEAPVAPAKKRKSAPTEE